MCPLFIQLIPPKGFQCPLKVPIPTPLLKERKKTIYRHVKSWQAPRITSPIPTTGEASAFHHNGDGRVCAASVTSAGIKSAKCKKQNKKKSNVLVIVLCRQMG